MHLTDKTAHTYLLGALPHSSLTWQSKITKPSILDDLLSVGTDPVSIQLAGRIEYFSYSQAVQIAAARRPFLRPCLALIPFNARDVTGLQDLTRKHSVPERMPASHFSTHRSSCLLIAYYLGVLGEAGEQLAGTSGNVLWFRRLITTADPTGREVRFI